MKIFGLLDTQYSRFSSTIKSYLSQTLSDFSSKYGNATIFGQLIGVLGAVVQNIMLYIEDALVEQNKFTAQRKKSIYNLAAISGYEPSLGKASSVQLKVDYTPNNFGSTNIVISNNERLVCTQNGLTYNIILPQEAIIMSSSSSNSNRILQAVQGRFETQTFMATGGKYYTINFTYNGNFDIDYLQVKVNNELWERASCFYDLLPNSNQYVAKTSYNNGIDLIFGNDVHGRSLQEGDKVEVKYLVHDGEEGNLNTQEETYFIFDKTLYDTDGNEVDGNSIFNVTFASHDSVTSGSDSESKEYVRQMIGMNSRGLVLASPDHYKVFMNKFSFCGYNRTWSERGSMIVNTMALKNFKMKINNGSDYFNLTDSDFVLSENQKKSILDCIEKSGMQLGGISYNIVDPDICKYSMYLYIKLKTQQQDKEYLKNQIKTLVGDFFTNINSDIFIPKSDIVFLLKNNIPNIDSVDVYFLSEKNESAIRTGSYIKKNYKYNPSTNSYDVESELVKVYPGENPNLGLDAHGNIYLNTNNEFPALMGGWYFTNNENQTITSQPITITIE